VAGYTAFLFGQAEGRDFWQSPLLLPILLVQALVAGTAALLLMLVAGGALEGRAWLSLVLGGGLIGLFVLVASELLVPHADLHVARLLAC
jgi:Ni/Fe-hydrogenase subunit HybB-like protein